MRTCRNVKQKQEDDSRCKYSEHKGAHAQHPHLDLQVVPTRRHQGIVKIHGQWTYPKGVHE